VFCAACKSLTSAVAIGGAREPVRQTISGPGHRDRAVGVVQDGVAHRTEHEPSEAVAAVAADGEQRRSRRFGDQRRGGSAADGLLDQVDVREAGPPDVQVLGQPTWSAIRECAEELLTAAEVDGLLGAQVWLTKRGFAWISVPTVSGLYSGSLPVAATRFR
jgi:hypothetical protein